METQITVTIGNDKLCLDVKEELGKGAFGTVVRAVDNRGISFALKSILCKDNDSIDTIACELDILFRLKHVNIVKLYAIDFQNSQAILVMEYCSLGTLNKRLANPVDIKLKLKWMEQLTTALTYLHSNNIVHRDLKTDNILLSDNDCVKLADFGVARHFVCCKYGRVEVNPNNYLSEYLDTFMGSFAGTPFWVAPEVFDSMYTEKADIFSLGTIFHAICERQFCTYNNENYYGVFTDYNGQPTGIGLVMYELQKNIKPYFIETQNKKMISSITSMLSFHPDVRISLINLHMEISEAFCDVLQLDKPPIVIDDNDEQENLNDSFLNSVFCCRNYEGYESLM